MNEAFGKANLDLAWKWIRTNPDNKYKKHFRKAYERFSLIEEVFLSDIQERLENQVYEPTSCISLYLPKKSGGLRPLSLLTTEDQVVYQCIANIVADKLYKTKYKGNIYRKVFGNIYAGTENIWFYENWKTGYELFKNALKRSFKNKKVYMAEFDIAACFDTIDHKVLSKLLKDLGVNPDLCERLTYFLEYWTMHDSDPKLFKGHGLPQGPLSSGVFAEVILKEFDSSVRVKNVDYFRYVDDIKLMAESEVDLRIALTQLDLKAKSIGLTPQSSKINIHRIDKIEDEFKTISLGGEYIETFTEKNSRLTSIVEKLTYRNKIDDETKFKYYFSVINPTAKMTRKVINLYQKYPHLFENFNNYLRKLKKVSGKTYQDLKVSVQERQPYDVSKATFIDTLINLELNEKSRSDLTTYIKQSIWKRSNSFKNDNQYLFAISSAYLIKNNLLTEKQIDFIFKDITWHSKIVLLENLRGAQTIHAQALKNIKTCSESVESDVQIVAYETLISILDPNLDNIPNTQRSLTFSSSLSFAHQYLTQMGYTSIDPVDTNSIGILLDEIFGNDRTSFSHINWNLFIDNRKIDLWRQLILLKASEKSNAHSWINILDNVNEILTRRLFDIYPSLGTFSRYGSVLPHNAGKKCVFKVFNPLLFNDLRTIHERRSSNYISHTYGKHRDNKLFEHSEIPAFKRKQRSVLVALVRKAVKDGTMVPL